jgi:hypothetical protein
MTAPTLDVTSAVADAVSASLAVPVEQKKAARAAAAVTPEATDLEEEPEQEAPAPAEPGDADADASDTEASETQDAPTDVELPEGYVAPKSISDKMATEFVISDADGEIEVPDVIIEYKANGKLRKDRIDQVVKLAQWGAYNQDKVAEIERVAVTASEERDQLVQMLEEREAQLERLLTDDEYMMNVREVYERENSPEKRVTRAEQEVQNVRVQAQMERIASQGSQFYRDEVVPALAMIQEALPTVEMGEMEERIAYAMTLHAEQAPNGGKYLPPSQFAKLRQYLVQDLVFWAQMQHAMRTEGKEAPPAVKSAAPAKANPDVTRAQAEAQKAKQALARASRPMGRGTDGKFREAPKAKPINTVDDAMGAALSAVMANIPQ